MTEQRIMDIKYGEEAELQNQGWRIKQVVCTFVDAMTFKKCATVLVEREVNEEEVG